MLFGILQLLFLVVIVFDFGVAERDGDDELNEFYHRGTLVKPEDVFPKNYSYITAPTVDGNPTTVVVSLVVDRLPKVDESSMTFTIGCYFHMKWTDPQLKYPLPTNTTRTKMTLPTKWLDKMWKPDVIVYNLREMSLFTMTTEQQYSSLSLAPGGRIYYPTRVVFELYCPMDFHKYPHDDQECNIHLASFEKTKDEYDLKWQEYSAMYGVGDIASGLTQLSLVSNSTEDCSFQIGEWAFACLKGKFQFRRNLGHILFHIYVPTIIIVMVSWLSFWLSYEDVTERVMLGITTLLTIFAQHSISGELIPPVSYLTAVDIFMLMSTMFVFLSILEFSVVYVLARDVMKQKEQEEQRIEMNHSLHFGNAEEDVNKATVVCGTDSSAAAEGKLRWALKLDKISRYAGPASYIILNVIYWIVYEVL